MREIFAAPACFDKTEIATVHTRASEIPFPRTGNCNRKRSWDQDQKWLLDSGRHASLAGSRSLDPEHAATCSPELGVG